MDLLHPADTAHQLMMMGSPELRDSRENQRIPKSSHSSHKQEGKVLRIDEFRNPSCIDGAVLESPRFAGNLVDEHHSHDRVTLLNLINTCQKEKNIRKVSKIHAMILKDDLITKDAYITSALITTYARCGVLAKAKEVFEQLPSPTVVCWNALITGYVRNGLGDEALSLFQTMQDLGFQPSSVTYISVLKACGSVGSLETGERISNEIRKHGLLQKDNVLGTALVDMYFKCGALDKAQEVFNELSMPNVVSWNSLISGYTRNGHGHKAINCFRQMQDAGICPNVVTYISTLKACGIVESLEVGEDIHAKVREQGLFGKDVLLGTALMDMYFKCHALEKAQRLFDQLPIRDTVAWNALIGGYVQHGLGDEALKCSKHMQDEGVCQDVVTYICVLKACAIAGSLEIGKELDAKIRKQKLLQKDAMLGTTLLDMYLKCGALEKAQEVFDQLPTCDVVSWSALITGYAQHGHFDNALRCFRQMQDEGVYPDTLTYISILKTCSIMASLEIGENIEHEIRNQMLLQKDVMLGNALLEMYSKCGALNKAQEVFERLPMQNVMSWNALIAGYTYYGLNYEALKCFKHMKDMDICPNGVTYVCILKICGVVGSLGIGKDVHAQATKQGLLQKDLLFGNTLVSMYSKCCALEEAVEVFQQLPECDIVAWNALLAGYSQLGKTSVVFSIYREMGMQDVLPNSVTFNILLTTCSHTGLVDEGEKLYYGMCNSYHIVPTEEHYTCMIDLFGRAGNFANVIFFLENLPHCDIVLLLLAVLGACRKWINVELGRWAFDQSLQSNENCAAAYVCMENIYAASGMQMEADVISRN